MFCFPYYPEWRPIFLTVFQSISLKILENMHDILEIYISNLLFPNLSVDGENILKNQYFKSAPELIISSTTALQRTS